MSHKDNNCLINSNVFSEYRFNTVLKSTRLLFLVKVGIKLCNRLYAMLTEAESKINILKNGEGAEEEFLVKE